MRTLLAFLSASFLCAQSVSVGVKGGVRTTNAVYGQLGDESKRYVVGPAVEFELPHKLSLEIDALYSRHGYSRGIDFRGLFSSFERERANSWEFPVLVKGNFALGRQHLFAGAGYSAQNIRGVVDGLTIVTDRATNRSQASRFQSPTHWNVGHGFVTAAGLRFTKGYLQISPEFRYTRWIRPAIGYFGSRGDTFESTPNQVDFILGISWKKR